VIVTEDKEFTEEVSVFNWIFGSNRTEEDSNSLFE
jgi:hypothetical protein